MNKFEWDENKNRSNKAKHKVSFEKAVEVFDDKNAVEFQAKSDTELRILRIGKTLSSVLLAVVYTVRLSALRIISARSARKEEVRSYLETNLPKQSKDEN